MSNREYKLSECLHGVSFTINASEHMVIYEWLYGNNQF